MMKSKYTTPKMTIASIGTDKTIMLAVSSETANPGWGQDAKEREDDNDNGGSEWTDGLW